VGSVPYNHPIGKDYEWYISSIYCLLGDYIGTSHLLREPGNSIDKYCNNEFFELFELAAQRFWLHFQPVVVMKVPTVTVNREI